MKRLALAVSMMATLSGLAQQSTAVHDAAATAQTDATAQPPQDDRGQVVFQRNCARCHTPPDGFSPRISKTVAMHMRVKANLSEADYKALLHFLNP